MIRIVTIGLVVALAACSSGGLGQFVSGDINNAAALAKSGNDVAGATCLQMLAPAASPTPNPSQDGLFVLKERKRLIEQAVASACGPVIAPMLLQDIGKTIPAPFNLVLPF